MDDGFLNWGFMPSTTGYILVRANSEYASIDTTLLKSGSFEEVYPEFINQVMSAQRGWFSETHFADQPQDLRNEFAKNEIPMLNFLRDTPISEMKKIMEPLTLPIGFKNADGPIWVSFNGWDWDWGVGFTFKVRGPYLQPMKHSINIHGVPFIEAVRDAVRDGKDYEFTQEHIPICSYWAEDSTDEYYGTNISLMKLET